MIKFPNRLLKDRLFGAKCQNGIYYLSNGFWMIDARQFRGITDSGIVAKIAKGDPFFFEAGAINEKTLPPEFDKVFPDLSQYSEGKILDVLVGLKSQAPTRLIQNCTSYVGIDDTYAGFLENLPYHKLLVKDAVSAVVALDTDNQILALVMPMRFDMPDCIVKL